MDKPDQVNSFLKSVARVMEAYITFHYFSGLGASSYGWSYHSCPACKAQSAVHKDKCVPYCAGLTHRELASLPEGRIQTCPNGVTEIVVPVYTSGKYAGVLYAGGYWNEERDAPYPGMIRVPDKNYLPDRLVAMQCFASGLGKLLGGKVEKGARPSDRRTVILEYIASNMNKKIALPQLSGQVGLSPSRTRHLIKELFDMTFSELVKSTKMQQALYLLQTSDDTVSRIAALTGYADADYFSRIFTRHFGQSPLKVRRSSRIPKTA